MILYSFSQTESAQVEEVKLASLVKKINKSAPLESEIEKSLTRLKGFQIDMIFFFKKLLYLRSEKSRERCSTPTKMVLNGTIKLGCSINICK